MPFERPIRIADVVEGIHRRGYLLPSIQRELVWDADQMELLWDSILRGYPIGSFLFWSVAPESKNDFQFYEFICDYHERDLLHNPKASVSGPGGVTAVLDGQQRLTALYMGLRGSRADRAKYGRRDNDAAYKKRTLHLNLAQPAGGEERRYDFKFLQQRQSEAQTDDQQWFRVGDVLGMKGVRDVSSWLDDAGLADSEFAQEALYKLWEYVHVHAIINFFSEEEQSLDKVLNIFIRVNSGGTELDYSDLLLSIATAQWVKLDAREEIHAFVDGLNRIGQGITFTKDFVLKACLVLNDIPGIEFKVDNFKRSNMIKIEEGWERSTKALTMAVECVLQWGFSRRTLTSRNAIIPAAYYLLRRDLPTNYPSADRYRDDREIMRRWLVLCLLRRTFSRNSDGILRVHREVLGGSADGFPLQEIHEQLRRRGASLRFADDEVDVLLDVSYSDREAFLVLSLLCPWMKFSERFHIDHVHPQHSLGLSQMEEAGIKDARRWSMWNNRDRLPNLQLLEGIPNQEKQDRPFVEWLEQTYPDGDQRSAFCARHLIPDTDLSLAAFMDFVRERSDLMKSRLRDVLNSSLGSGQ